LVLDGQGTVIGLELSELARFKHVNDYFVGSGEYYDGARSANTLRQAALILSTSGLALTAVLLIVSAIGAACRGKLTILSVGLVSQVDCTAVVSTDCLQQTGINSCFDLSRQSDACIQTLVMNEVGRIS